MKHLILSGILAALLWQPASGYTDHRGYNMDSLEVAVSAWLGSRLETATREEYESVVSGCMDLMFGYQPYNAPRCRYWADKVYNLSGERNWYRSMMDACKVKGAIFWAEEQYDSAAWYYKHAISLIDKMAAGAMNSAGEPYSPSTIDDCYSSIYGQIGNLYSMQDSIPQAMKYYEMAGEIFERHGWNESNSILWYNIGETWVGEEEYKKALPAYERSLEYARAAKDSLLEANALKGLGGLYMDTGKTARALRCLRAADEYYSSHDKEEYVYQIENLTFIERVLTRQKRSLRLFVLISLALLVLLALVEVLLRRLRRMEKVVDASDQVIEEAISESARRGSPPVLVEGTGGVPYLTEREEDILRLVAQGIKNSDIADKLCLSLATIKWYRKRLTDKFDVANTAELVSRAKELGII